MSTLYQSITKLDQLNEPYSRDDLFIITRPTGQNTYKSYKATYSALSTDIYNRINVQIPVLTNLINSASQINQGGTRIVQENAAYEILHRTDALQNNDFVSKTTFSIQTIQGPVIIDNDLCVNQEPTEDNHVATKSYVDDIANDIDSPVFITKKGAIHLSSFIITNSRKNADISQGVIYQGDSNPIVVYVPQDCILQILFTSKTGIENYGIFTYDCLDNGSSYDKIRGDLLDLFEENKEITGEESDTSNLHLIEIFHNEKFSCKNIPIKGGTYVCVSKGLTPVTKKTTIKVQVVDKNYNRDKISEHKTDAKSYTNSSGYYYHYEQKTNKCNKTYWDKVYDYDNNGKKQKRYINGTKEVNTVGIKLKKGNLENGECIIFSYFD